jgi:diguanylate cyclase (GGDEF)-like protein/PAS domain S-box-containing protein
MAGGEPSGASSEHEAERYEKFRVAFEQSRDALMLLDRDGFEDANPAALAMFRVPDVATFSSIHPAFLSPRFQPDGRASREAGQGYIDQALAEGQAFFEWHHCTWEGEEFPAEVFLSRIDLGDRPVLQAVVRDISQRKAMEGSLHRYRAAFEQSRDAVMFLGPDKYREGNPATLALFGVDSNATFREYHPAQFSPPFQPDGRPSPEAAQARIQEAFDRGQAFFEWQHRTLDGQEFPTEVLLSRIDHDEQAVLQVVVRDISERKAAEAKLRERVKELRTLRDVILLTTDDERPLQALLDACANRLPAGWMEPEQTAARIRAGGLEAVSEPFFETGIRQHAQVDDRETPVEVEVFRSDEDPSGPFLAEEQQLLDSVAQQIHNALLRRQAQQDLERLASQDPLTGIPNRAKLYELLDGARRENERYGTPFSVIMLDIDHFKAVNDHYGHQVGDEVLYELSRCVDDALRDTDTVGRWGGEEFLVLARHADGRAAFELAERLRARAARTPIEGVGPVTISLGVASHEPGETVEGLEARVDDALYAAKEAGRDRVVMAEGPTWETWPGRGPGGRSRR